MGPGYLETAVVGPCKGFSQVRQMKKTFFRTAAQSGIFECGNFLLFVSAVFPGNTASLIAFVNRQDDSK